MLLIATFIWYNNIELDKFNYYEYHYWKRKYKHISIIGLGQFLERIAIETIIRSFLMQNRMMHHQFKPEYNDCFKTRKNYFMCNKYVAE